MRFVAMRLHNIQGKYTHKSENSDDDVDNSDSGNDSVSEQEEEEEEEAGRVVEGSWVASMEGFLKYLVDCKLVFDTVERIVDKSDNVSCECFLFFLTC